LGEKKRRLAAGVARSDDHARKVRELLAAAQLDHRTGRLREARDLYQQLLELEPALAPGWLGLGTVALHARALDAAIAFLAKAVELAPEMPEARLRYAHALQERGHLEAAEEQLQAACRLAPAAAQCWEDLGIVAQALGETEQALQAYRKACELQPTLARRIKEATVVSPVIASRESMVAERRHMDSALDGLLAEPARAADDPVHAALWPNFYWAFQGLSDRELYEKAARTYRHLFPPLDYVAKHCSAPRMREGKIRVGLISQFFRNHSIGRTSRGLFAKLSREKFDVTALFIAPAVNDEFSRFIRQHADRCVDVPQDLAAARRAIEASQLDVLFYQDIGMEPFGYFLAFSRLAPVQCASFGHPDTTGIPAVDYFVSNDLYETPASAAHYSERLFLLRNLGTLAYYYRPGLPEPRKDRAHFNLRDSDHVYICPQNLFKFHPDMDELISGVLRRDAQGKLVAIEGRIGRWTELIRRRWAASMPDVMDRVVFLPRMESSDYVNLIELSDVMLDTRHFNGMNTSLEAFAVGTPVVTWPGEFQRGRHTQAMYRKMGLAHGIVDNAADYIDRAIRLGTDPGYRAEVRKDILASSAVLFEDAQVVREFERFFEEAVRDATATAA
jgi:predicted O-linked N-acetylglucosamine transferase (SPINDLY family)